MFGPVETWCQECYGSNKKKNVNSLRDQIKGGKGFHTKKHEKVYKRQDSIERCEKSENDRHENESSVHVAHRKETNVCSHQPLTSCIAAYLTENKIC